MTVGMTQSEVNNRLIQNDDYFRNQLSTMSNDITEIKTTVKIHLEAEKKLTNIKLSIFGIVVAAGSTISVIFL